MHIFAYESLKSSEATVKRTFESEDKRKDRLFEAWNIHLKKMEERWGNHQFDEIVGGIAVVVSVSSDRLRIRWTDMKRAGEVEITSEISSFTSKEDCLMIAAGRIGKQWWPLDVESIGSVVRGKKAGIHMTVNPLLMEEYRSVGKAALH